jgi:hypothetical protein
MVARDILTSRRFRDFNVYSENKELIDEAQKRADEAASDLIRLRYLCLSNVVSDGFFPKVIADS